MTDVEQRKTEAVLKSARYRKLTARVSAALVQHLTTPPSILSANRVIKRLLDLVDYYEE